MLFRSLASAMASRVTTQGSVLRRHLLPQYLHQLPLHQQPVRRGRLNHVSAEEAEEDPGVLMGMLRINDYPASVLFDSGASHSFISIAFAHNHQIPFVNMDSPLVIKTPGFSWHTHWMSPEVQISIATIPFPFSLIALKSEGLDVILGMD